MSSSAHVESTPYPIHHQEPIPFVKLEGTGNDFIVVQARDLPHHVDLAALGRRWCDRHFGIGADGILIVHTSAIADARMQIINSDGSEAKMCGNGIRCLVRYLDQHNHRMMKEDWTIETLAGLIHPRIISDGDGFAGVRVDMGEPHLTPSAMPVVGYEGDRAVNVPIAVDGHTFQATFVSMGNPHCVIFVEDLEAFPFERLGPMLESHPAFPDGANIEFVQVLSPEHVKVKVWERGAGATLACGTGAGAVAVAANLNGHSGRSLKLDFPGGPLQVEWQESDNRVYLTGPAHIVFTGAIAP